MFRLQTANQRSNLMTNTNAGKDIVLDEVGLNAALQRAFCIGRITSDETREIITAYLAAEQKAVPGDDELVARAICLANGEDPNMIGELPRGTVAVASYAFPGWFRYSKQAKAALSVIRKQRTPDARIVEVLKFYADERNWSLKDYRQYDAITSHIEQDKGNKAKQLLAEMGG